MGSPWASPLCLSMDIAHMAHGNPIWDFRGLAHGIPRWDLSGLDGLAHLDPTWAPHGLAIWVQTRMLRMLPTFFGKKAVNCFKPMPLGNYSLNQHRNLRGATLIPLWISSLVKAALYCQKPLSYYVSQIGSRTYTVPLETVKKHP